MDAFATLLAAGCGLFLTLAVFILCIKRYEIAVFLVILSPWLPVAFRANVEADLEETGVGSYLRIGLVLLLGIAGTVRFLLFHKHSHRPLPVHFQLLGVFLFFALLSTVYSIDMRFTLIRAGTAIAFFAFLIGFWYWLREDEHCVLTERVLFLTVCLGTLVNLAAMIVLPDRVWWWNDPTRFQGLLGHPNTMGSFCMVSYVILLWAYTQAQGLRRSLTAALLVGTSALLLLTGSRTSLVCSAFGIIVWLVARKQKAVLLSFVTVMLIAGTYLLQFHPERFERRRNESVTDLTGRSDFWVAAYQLISESPVLGYGYGVDGKVWNDPRFYRHSITLWKGSARASLHNSYVTIAVSGGIGAVVLWIILLFIPAWQCRFWSSDGAKAFVLSMTAICALHSFAESDFAGVSSPAAVVFWIAWTIGGTLTHPRDAQHNDEVIA